MTSALYKTTGPTQRRNPKQKAPQTIGLLIRVLTGSDQDQVRSQGDFHFTLSLTEGQVCFPLVKNVLGLLFSV